MGRLPPWFRRPIPFGRFHQTSTILEEYRLNTVCESALCPNRSECWSQKTATFMILGNRCTRRCGFCAIKTALPEPIESEEPERVAEAARALGLQYVVVTSVARDDLMDEGAGQFARTIEALKQRIQDVEVEVLTPDFHARPELIDEVCQAGPAVYNHNLETVSRFQKQVRPQAGYRRSLKVIERVKQTFPQIRTKSGLMLGLGETQEEVLDCARDLCDAGCEILTLGQYLQPSEKHLPVVEYIPVEVFKALADTIRQMGLGEVYAGPYVRSSYHAAEIWVNVRGN